MSIPAHLFRRNGIFYFRWALPASVRRLLRPSNQWEVRVSLRGHDRRVAIPAAFQLWQRALMLADTIVATGRPVGYTEFMAQLLPDNNEKPDHPSTASSALAPDTEPQAIAEILGTYDLPTLQRAIAALHNRNHPVFVSISDCDVTFYRRNEVDMNEFVEEIDRVKDNYVESHAQLLPATIRSIVASSSNQFSFQRFLAPQISPAKVSTIQYELAEATHPIQRNITQVRAIVKDTRSVAHIVASAAHSPTHATGNSIQRVNLTAALRRWIEEHSGQGKNSLWNSTTAKENPAYIELFIQFIGDKATCDVSVKDAQDYRELIKALPPNFRKKPQYANLSPVEVAALSKEHGRQQPSARTQEKKLQIASSFFRFCVQESYIATNPFANLGKQIAKVVKNKEKRETARESFTDVDLRLLFESDTALKLFEKQQQASRLWVPVLGLYTGARLAELCELRAAQVDTKDGVSFIELREWDEKENRLKNESAPRQIPLHPVLVDLGFVAYAESRKSSSAPMTALFPEQQDLDHKQGNKIVSRFFNEVLLKGLGIKTKKKVFHSFRHTVVDKFKRSAAKDGMISAFVGHEDGDAPTWQTTYGSDLQAEYTQELLQFLNYPIDWSKFGAMLQRKKLVGKPSIS